MRLGVAPGEYATIATPNLAVPSTDGEWISVLVEVVGAWTGLRQLGECTRASSASRSGGTPSTNPSLPPALVRFDRDGAGLLVSAGSGYELQWGSHGGLVFGAGGRPIARLRQAVVQADRTPTLVCPELDEGPHPVSDVVAQLRVVWSSAG